MRHLGDPRLTNPYPPGFASSVAQTYGGMANFAGTGPFGKTCRECLGWCRGAEKFVRDEIKDGGGLRPRRCLTFSRLMQGLEGAGVPHDAKACRHFTEAANPPPVEAPSITRKRRAAERRAAKAAAIGKRRRRET